MKMMRPSNDCPCILKYDSCEKVQFKKKDVILAFPGKLKFKKLNISRHEFSRFSNFQQVKCLEVDIQTSDQI